MLRVFNACFCIHCFFGPFSIDFRIKICDYSFHFVGMHITVDNEVHAYSCERVINQFSYKDFMGYTSLTFMTE